MLLTVLRRGFHHFWGYPVFHHDVLSAFRDVMVTKPNGAGGGRKSDSAGGSRLVGGETKLRGGQIVSFCPRVRVRAALSGGRTDRIGIKPSSSRTPQAIPERETHHFRRVPDFGSPAGKRLAGSYRRITHHSHQFGAFVFGAVARQKPHVDCFTEGAKLQLNEICIPPIGFGLHDVCGVFSLLLLVVIPYQYIQTYNLSHRLPTNPLGNIMGFIASRYTEFPMTSNTLLPLSLDLYPLGLSISDWHAPARIQTDPRLANSNAQERG